MSCWQTVQDYGLRAIGLGERLLPTADITLCHQFTLIGSGLIWNVYFGAMALALGFSMSLALALGKASQNPFLRVPADWFIFVFRGSPLFIQFFLAYEAFVLLPRNGIEINLIFVEITAETRWLTRAWAGALVVLILNTSAYAGEIFYGALRAVPKGDLEAADAYGMTGWIKFRRVTLPCTLRLAWPSYTNEAIFLYHATTLVYFSGIPARRQQGDALYYAKYFADKTFNPFVPYPIVAAYFICLTLLLIWLFGTLHKRLNRHVAPEARSRLRLRMQLVR